MTRQPEAVAAASEAIAVDATTWRGLPAWRLLGRDLDCVVTAVGAHLAAIRRRGEALNPLWQPPWPAADPATVRGGGRWGDGPEAPLLAGICGHNLCCDRFGGPWPGEDRPVHGEAGVLAWTIAPPARDAVEWRVDLPLARLRLYRRIRLRGDEVRLETGIRHDGDAPRAIEWAEHPTVGGDFLDGAVFTAGIDRVWNWPADAEPGSRFADRGPGEEIAVADALAFPPPNASACGDVLAGRVVEGWWTAEHAALRRRLTYRFDPARFPWLAIWTQHRSRAGAPWHGRVRSRGMEFSTKPFPEGLPPAERATAWQGRPTTCVVPPGRGLETFATIRWQAL